MRKLILLPLLLLGVLVFSPSCKKKYPDANNISAAAPDETINVKIGTNQPYQLSLIDGSTVSISRQAIHFSVSEALVNTENGIATYKYVPATDFSGSDEVVLLSTKTGESSSASSGACSTGSNGAPSNNKYITFKITVGN